MAALRPRLAKVAAGRGLAARRRHPLDQLPRFGMAESTAARQGLHLRVGLRRLDVVPRGSRQAADLGRARRRVACPRPGGDPAAAAARTGEPAPRAGRLPAAAGDHPARTGGGCRRRALPLRPARDSPAIPSSATSGASRPCPTPASTSFWSMAGHVPAASRRRCRSWRPVPPCCSTTPTTLTRRP